MFSNISVHIYYVILAYNDIVICLSHLPAYQWLFMCEFWITASMTMNYNRIWSDVVTETASILWIASQCSTSWNFFLTLAHSLSFSIPVLVFFSMGLEEMVADESGIKWSCLLSDNAIWPSYLTMLMASPTLHAFCTNFKYIIYITHFNC